MASTALRRPLSGSPSSCNALQSPLTTTRLSIASSSNHHLRPLLPLTTTRSAIFLARPRRQFQFQQTVMLSDGSSFTHRTTSPRGVLRFNKDIRNHPMWNPREARLFLIEEDEAGKLRAFRAKFGRGFDSAVTRLQALAAAEKQEEAEGVTGLVDKVKAEMKEEDSLLEMIAGHYDRSAEKSMVGQVRREKDKNK